MELSLIEELQLAINIEHIVKVESMLENDMYTCDEKQLLRKYYDLYCKYIEEAVEFIVEETLVPKSLDKVREFRHEIFPYIWSNKLHLNTMILVFPVREEERRLRL